MDLARTQDPHTCMLCVPMHAFEHVSSHGNLPTRRPQLHISFFPPTSSQYMMHLSQACTFPSPTRALHSTSPVCTWCSYQPFRTCSNPPPPLRCEGHACTHMPDPRTHACTGSHITCGHHLRRLSRFLWRLLLLERGTTAPTNPHVPMLDPHVFWGLFCSTDCTVDTYVVDRILIKALTQHVGTWIWLKPLNTLLKGKGLWRVQILVPLPLPLPTLGPYPQGFVNP